MLKLYSLKEVFLNHQYAFNCRHGNSNPTFKTNTQYLCLEYPALCATCSPEEQFWVLELVDRAAVCCCGDSMSQLNLTIDFTGLLIVRFLEKELAKHQIQGKSYKASIDTNRFTSTTLLINC